MNSQTEQLFDETRKKFVEYLGRSPSVIVRAPGRVNLIGEHTDYNEGFVLPCAIDYSTLIACRLRDDNLVKSLAVDMNFETDTFDLKNTIEFNQILQWPNYIRGVFNQFKSSGTLLPGMDFVIAGNIPQGAGLSSSASLAVAVGQAIKSLLNLKATSSTDLALIAQRAENDFVGCHCGIMDQLVSANGQEGHALLIDCRDLKMVQIPIPLGVSVLVVDSRVSRQLVNSEYNLRRQQCEVAAQYFGSSSLRDVTVAQVRSAENLDPLIARRATHVTTENQRTLAAAEALKQSDLRHLGALMAQSHLSMKDDFQITVPSIDELVTILSSVIGNYGGARMTGGGFGGCAVAILPNDMVDLACAAVRKIYRSPNNEKALFYNCIPSAGVNTIACK